MKQSEAVRISPEMLRKSLRQWTLLCEPVQVNPKQAGFHLYLGLYLCAKAID